MLCCGVCCGNMSKRDYKVATMDGIELEPLGGEKIDKEKEKDKEKQTNGVTFGGESSGRQTRQGVAVCSQRRALVVAGVVFSSLLLTALIIAYAGPQNDCSCAGKMAPGFETDEENDTQPFNPIATNGEPYPWLEVALPTSTRPLRYMVTIHPNLTTLDVKGQVTIDLFMEIETNFIVLHIQDLNVTDRAIVTTGNKGYAIKIVKVLEYPPRQQLYIEVKEKLKKKSNYTLNLRWYSKLNPEPEGFYVDQYESSNGLERLLAATVFRPNSARRAFPCFDEPQIRAPFRISVFRDRFHIGLSNSIVHTTEDVGFYMGTGLLRDDFIETPPLPADAVAWVVSDFQRESLQPSPAYLPTTPAPPGSVGSKKSTQLSNYPQLKEKKPPVRNITALTHSLNINLMKNTTTTTVTPTAESNGKNLTSLSQSTGSLIKRAPSYTFYAPRDLLPRSSFILHTARDVLEHLQTWLDILYPLTKVDFVALPSLDRNIISSLGLVTLKTAFLTDPESITTEEYQKSALQVAEAMVRQFFGGITSRKVLKDVWLWEGLIKYLGIHSLSPQQTNWPLREMYLLKIATTALDIDAIQGWDSIMNGTKHDGNNEEFFIQKTAAIFSMLHTAIGEDRFRGCLGAFLKINRFKTAEPTDLWTICTKKANGSKNIKDMMTLWTHQPGFPLLTVTKLGNSVSISQRPFKPADFLAIHDETYDGNNYNKTVVNVTGTPSTVAPTAAGKTKQPTKMKWIFPITYITDTNNVSETLWLQNIDVTFNVPENVKWIKVNAMQSGYYRVLYNDDNWANLIEELSNNPEKLSSEDRIGLLSDSFTLCHANLLPCEITMNMIQYLPSETNWGPMTVALRHLEKWRRILKYSECFLMLSEFIKMKLATVIEKIGWTDDGDEAKRLMRPEVLLSSVLWEDIDSITKAKNMLNQFLYYNGTAIPPNLREVVYTGSILSGEYIYWQHCWERFIALQRTSESFVERMQLLRALGRTKDAWLQNRLLSHVTMLPTVEVVQVLQAIAGTPTGGAMACRFLQAKWFELETRLGHGTLSFAKVISAITQYGATKFDYDELKSLVHRFGRGPGMEVLNMTLSSVASNVEWVARSQTSLYKWVESNLHSH
ncbi:endoplasmic reticulum aminopeptidase 2 isoform X1 [Bactrocera dorsalis]|uniref:Endoplasmic reticulum aminopeptidase 2 isoform X1 n=2 Tax=Bactrocera dorsalis TaxID=27457 RepID=A0ABM3JBB4_BACDO|nr:endoplasmic reticulum aminopeptidase 2 isoform X1 [Bactrocera dorsalis]XP_049306511.1 endoplasmic reticulum aminopeptidase 2 isoform X1 [Bactrocera dorsalis]XP_049306512.1 endoplasmic reticulum aminopeptidase 2 isoform X1 [Bactrocera dorsalis]